MNYFIKREIILLILYTVFTVILMYKRENNKVKYWKIVKCFIILLGLEPMLQYFFDYVSNESDTYTAIYAGVVWVIVNITYVLIAIGIYEAFIPNETEILYGWKELPVWVKRIIIASIGVGGILTVLDFYSNIKMLEQVYESAMNGTGSMMDILLMSNYTTSYFKIKETLRIVNICSITGGLLITRLKIKE
ncbi:hypothetical protein [Roseburia sp. MSJ-14]|uniref:hypothetical protein n=1 Tax=Roseburia sp. MSJ-14 TaxID=2841514 RepID=UPI001C0F9652|nr:hypothetical protein [Roseburia sp. MSJ-14]MBU5472210.1 hypothetical protein [Roseburia sp. MSJ-14]